MAARTVECSDAGEAIPAVHSAMNAEMPTLKREAFTLLEMLVAMAVVALMMAFMFSMVGQTIRTWEVGGRRVESAQAARIGMSLIANELQYAMAGVSAAAGMPTPSTNLIPFAPIANAQSLPGETSANLEFVHGSDQLFFVAPLGAIGSQTAPFGEVGYMTLYAKSTGAHTMIGQRYYLVRHGSTPGSIGTSKAFQDFYYRGGATNSRWFSDTTNAATTANRTPLVDNCVQLSFEYASNSASGSIAWTNVWPSTTNLPLGVLITMRVLDNKSANRIAALRGDNKLTAAQISFLTNGQPSTDPVIQILREGTTTLRRFVPLLQAKSP
jgi:prepilin-type N-terminal cleavage/methylation domain-containing protein